MRMIVLTLATIALANSPVRTADPPMPTPDQQEKLKERDGLIREAEAMRKTGKFKEAISLVERILKLERAVLGELHADVLVDVEWLARLQEQAGDFSCGF